MRDLTLRALDAVRSADELVAEFYTSRLMGVATKDLEALFGKPVRELTREDVESRADELLEAAKQKTIAFLVVGDAMSATTHHDLKARAQEKGVRVEVLPGVSIFTAAPAAAGLQLYKFGRTTTIPFPEGKYTPDSPYDVIRGNKSRGLHTLVLLDIQADKGRFMTATEAVAILGGIESRRKEGVILDGTTIVGLARVGSPTEQVVAATAKEWPGLDLGRPLHCLIVPGELHFMEEAALEKLRPAASPTRSV